MIATFLALKTNSWDNKYMAGPSTKRAHEEDGNYRCGRKQGREADQSD